MKKVSVIVPVYNVEKYLNRCLNSLVKQTLKDIEIIVVNDGSPDNSSDIILKYVKKYKNVVYYNKENGGLSDARNFGIEHANGEYIAFVDSDDYVDKDMLKKLYNKASSSNFDIVCCNFDYVDDNGNFIKYGNSKVINDLNGDSIRRCMLDIYPTAWNKLYKKELFENGIRFKKGVWYEDVEFLYRLFPYVKSIGTINDSLYHYVQREGAITKTFDERLYHYIDNWNGIIKFYKENNFYNQYVKELEFCYVRYLYATFVKQATNYSDKEKYDEAVEIAITNVELNFPKYRKNKYFYCSLKGIYLVLFGRKIADIYYKKSVRRV